MLTLEEKIAALELENKELKASIKVKDGLIADMNKELDSLAEKSESRTPGPAQIKVGKKTFLLAVPSFQFEGKRHSVESFKEDRDLAERLLEVEGQQILIEKP